MIADVETPFVLARLAQVPHGIFDVDDGVVDDGGEGNDQPGQDHRVKGSPTQVEHEQGHHQRKRDRQEADQGSAPVEEEGDEDQHQQQGAQKQRRGEIADRHFDVIGRAEDVRVDGDAFKTGTHGLKRLFHPARQLQGVGIRKLFDNQQEGGAFAENHVADQCLVSFHDVGHVAQAADPSDPLTGTFARSSGDEMGRR